MEKTIQDLSKAIKLNPGHAAAYNNLGRAYGIKGEYEKAIQNYNVAIKIKADYANAYSNRGMAWLHLKEWKKARADLTCCKGQRLHRYYCFIS